MTEHPLDPIKRADPQLRKQIQEVRELALGEGVLPRKYKLLIALALDAAHGAVEGVRSLTKMAMDAGATRAEITEALRVAYYIHGASSIHVASRALQELF